MLWFLKYPVCSHASNKYFLTLILDSRLWVSKYLQKVCISLFEKYGEFLNTSRFEKSYFSDSHFQLAPVVIATTVDFGTDNLSAICWHDNSASWNNLHISLAVASVILTLLASSPRFPFASPVL